MLLRVHSECLTGDAFTAAAAIAATSWSAPWRCWPRPGAGDFVPAPGRRGIGLLEKVKAYILQESGLDTLDANLAPGHQGDAREYAVCQPMLAYLG